MDTNKRRYELEVWSIQGRRVADISHLARNRKFTLERNQAETLTFDLDLDVFQNYCQNNLGMAPQTVLYPYRTDIKLKRNGEYMFGTQVVLVSGSLGKDARTLTVQCTGYLNLFKDRYVTKTYSDIEATQIARDLIIETQSQTNGDMGVTIEEFPYETGIKRDRTFERANVKQETQRLTQLVNGTFDIGFTWDKQFKIYEAIGSFRSDLELTYPGNFVIGATIERSGLNIFNRIIGLGSGFGDDQLISNQNDTDSQLTYYLRERISLFNSVVLQNTLDQNAQGDLETYKAILEIPKITITGMAFADGKPFLSIGDRVPLAILDQPYFSNINAIYRVERMEVSLDDNDFENSIAIYFDDQGVSNEPS